MFSWCSPSHCVSVSHHFLSFIQIYDIVYETAVLKVLNVNHSENTPIQCKWHFLWLQKTKSFRWKNVIFFVIFARNRDCGYSLEPLHRGGSNGYPQSIFDSRNKKHNEHPCKSIFFFYIKVGFEGVKISWWIITPLGVFVISASNCCQIVLSSHII